VRILLQQNVQAAKTPIIAANPIKLSYAPLASSRPQTNNAFSGLAKTQEIVQNQSNDQPA
jgi:hypothetical protein